MQRITQRNQWKLLNKGYVKDYLKDKVIDTHDDHNLGLFMIAASTYKT